MLNRNHGQDCANRAETNFSRGLEQKTCLSLCILKY
nr:MAG TPA: hypothetical protein [Caudoviricetes sp.]